MISGRFWSHGARRLWCLAIIALSGFSVAHVNADESPVEVAIGLEQSILTVGEPLVLDMQVTNTSSDLLTRASVSSDIFRNTWYSGVVEEGCEIIISVGDPEPGNGRPDFAFDWPIGDLDAGETASCRVTFPMTLYSGTETVDYSVFGSTGNWERGELTYTLLPVHSDVPVELQASVEQTPQVLGEPLVIDLQARNISGEVLAPFVIESHEPFELPGYRDFSAEGCDVDVFGGEQSPSILRWYVPETQPDETVSCRLSFPDTLTPGTETLGFSAWVQGTRYEQLAAVSYALRAHVQAVPLGGPIWGVLAVLLMLSAAQWQLRLRRG